MKELLEMLINLPKPNHCKIKIDEHYIDIIVTEGIKCSRYTLTIVNFEHSSLENTSEIIKTLRSRLS